MNEMASAGSEKTPAKVICIITDDEMARLMALTTQAQNTPVIVTSGVGETQFNCAGKSWQRVRDLWEELGQKYAFNPAEVVLKPMTREILEDEKLRKYNLLYGHPHSKKKRGDRNRRRGRRKH